MSWKEDKEWQKFKKGNTGNTGIIIVRVAEIVMLQLDKDIDPEKINPKKMIKEADKYGEVTSMIGIYIAQAILKIHPKGEFFIKNW